MQANAELKEKVLSALPGASEACTALADFVLQAAAHFRDGEVQKGSELFSEILDDFSRLLTFAGDIRQFDLLGRGGEEHEMGRLTTELETTLDLLKTAHEAQENQDWVYLADILEYEFSERLGAWSGLLHSLADADGTAASP